MWQFGRDKPRLGGLNVEETVQRQEAARDERLKRGLETRRHCDNRRQKELDYSSCEHLNSVIYLYILV